MSSLERKGDTVFTTPNIDADDQESANRSRVSTSDDSLTIGSRVRNSIDILESAIQSNLDAFFTTKSVDPLNLRVASS